MFGSLKRTPARLGSWLARQRGCDGGSPALWRHPRVPRLAAVLVTALLVAAIAYAAGPPMILRVGQINARDLRVRAEFEVINFPQTEWAREEAGKAGIAPVVDKYPSGLPLVKRGQPITEDQIELLRTEHKAYRESLKRADHLRRAAALLVISLLLAFVLVLYTSRFQPALAGSLSRVVSIRALVVVTLAVGLLLSRSPWYALLIPMTVTAWSRCGASTTIPRANSGRSKSACSGPTRATSTSR